MECNFTVGQKVVLTRDFFPEVRASAPGDDIVLPDIGVEYTVRDIGNFEGKPLLFLNEIKNRRRFYADLLRVAEQGFDASRFTAVAEVTA
ncbi:hypothetical protein PCC82_04705 [Agrobacterium deltaense]